MAQMVEHILGKDEVTGSIPVISSTKNKAVALFFLCVNNKPPDYLRVYCLHNLMLFSKTETAFFYKKQIFILI